ncbi:RNA polymerase sigma factor [Spirosoma rhododendri]|uniref:Sigma-70 family RNA polymerase sigma factor n=1 Tax=Spirosoma rhododendri TaxID=2728024 RepID=A0A7L5DN95_9BACT|nr:sigma-70 family RNA polymerase sigma factor [Spirosoma rhododendri]QJD78951.1 sigma-70 family RNA polymerase sigma factor [Spirosoma rhododendri]
MKKTFTDEELVDRFIQSHEAADFAELYCRYSRKVYQSCIRYLEDSVEAQDQMQEVFFKVLKRLGGFRQEASFSTWLYTLTRNHCFTVRQQRDLRRHTLFSDTDLLETHHLPGLDGASLDDRWHHAEQTLNQLAGRDERILRDRYLLGKDIAVLADEHQVSISAIKMRLKRARDIAHRIHQRREL